MIKEIPSGYRRLIEEERSIKVRERFENYTWKHMTILCGILISGSIVGNSRGIISTALSALLSIMFLCVYLFYILKFNQDYTFFTNELIRLNESKSKRK